MKKVRISQELDNVNESAVEPLVINEIVDIFESLDSSFDN